MKKYILTVFILGSFVLTTEAKISVKRYENIATSTETILVDEYKVYTLSPDYSKQATCQEWKEAVPDTWTRVIAQNGVLVSSSGRCADIVLGGAKLGGVRNDSADIATLKKEIAELKRSQGMILRLINTVLEMLGKLMAK